MRSPSLTTPAATASYRFETVRNGKPARWNPCAAIPYTVNLSAAPPGALADDQEAVRRLRLRTGLDLRYAGTTSYMPNPFALNRQPRRIVIAWSKCDPNAPTQPWYQDGTLGLDPTYTEITGGKARIVRGAVLLNASYNGQVKMGFGAGSTWGAVLMHELAHVAGLGQRPAPHERPTTVAACRDVRCGGRAGRECRRGTTESAVSTTAGNHLRQRRVGARLNR